MPPKAARQERGLFCSSKLPFGLRSPSPVLTPGPLARRAHRFEATQKRLKSASAQRVEAAEAVAEEKEALDGGRKENSMARLCFVLYPSGKRCQMF